MEKLHDMIASMCLRKLMKDEAGRREWASWAEQYAAHLDAQVEESFIRPAKYEDKHGI